jgi:hypothetical protein
VEFLSNFTQARQAFFIWFVKNTLRQPPVGDRVVRDLVETIVSHEIQAVANDGHWRNVMTSMNPFQSNRRLSPLWLACCVILALATARAGTLFFQPSLDANGNITEAWSSVENWYFELTPDVIPANRLPAAGDTVFIVLSEYDCIVDVPSVEVAALITQANIVGGDFLVQTINSSQTTFNGSILNIQTEWQSSDNDQLLNGTANIMSGALLFLDGATLNVTSSTLDDIGQIELMDGGEIFFAAGTNQLTISSDAQFTSIGNNEVNNNPGNLLIVDNNGVVQSEGGTLLIVSDNVFWTNSSGKGYFTNITSNAFIEINGPFAVQTNCTNFVTGPGTFMLYNGIETTINGILQIGIADPSPGTFDYHAYILDGSGAINISGAPGLPSTLIWESGTFAGPPVNIDSNSLLIISNTFLKTMSNSVIYNGGTATWLVDGNTIQMDNGAVFYNLTNATFTAENSAIIQGGAGSSPSFFYNAGIFRKSVSSNSMNFAQDNPPAPSLYFLNFGLLDVQTGALYLEWGTNSGQYNVAQGAQLHYWMGTNAQKATATFTGPGLFTIESGDFWLETNLTMNDLQLDLNGAIDGPGDLTIDGLLTLSYGTVQGSGSLNISPTGSMVVSTNPVTFYRNVTNAGTILVTNSGVLAAQPLTWNNLPGGSLNLAGGSLGNIVGYSGPPPVLNNAGSLSNAGPNLVTTSVNWTVTNSGDIVVYPYALDLDQPVTQISGSTQVNPGATLAVSTSFGHTLQVQGGILEGHGEVTGSIINSATIHPGDSPGILTVGFGTLTNEPGADLAVDIAGTAPGTQYSQINGAGGQAWLDNLGLTVTFDNGFVPTIGQSFVIWTNGQIKGAFSSLEGIQTGNIILVPNYTASAVTLVATAALAPSFTSDTFSFSFPTTAGQTNTVQYTPSLSPANWQTLTNLIGNGQVQTFTDATATNQTRFYRVVFE